MSDPYNPYPGTSRLPPSLRRRMAAKLRDKPLYDLVRDRGAFESGPLDARNTSRKFPELARTAPPVPLAMDREVPLQKDSGNPFDGTSTRGSAVDPRLLEMRLAMEGLIRPSEEARAVATEVENYETDEWNEQQLQREARRSDSNNPLEEVFDDDVGLGRGVPAWTEELNKENARRQEAEAYRKAAEQYELERQENMKKWSR